MPKCPYDPDKEEAREKPHRRHGILKHPPGEAPDHPSLPEIGRQFGGKHHTTVLHSINKSESQRRSDKELDRTLNRLLDSLET